MGVIIWRPLFFFVEGTLTVRSSRGNSVPFFEKGFRHAAAQAETTGTKKGWPPWPGFRPSDRRRGPEGVFARLLRRGRGTWGACLTMARAVIKTGATEHGPLQLRRRAVLFCRRAFAGCKVTIRIDFRVATPTAICAHQAGTLSVGSGE